jgi:hypothetical protein
VERPADRLKQVSGKKGAGRVSFLAHLEDIRASLAAGHTVRAAHRLFAARVPVSYSQFARHVNALLKRKEIKRETPAEAAQPPAESLAGTRPPGQAAPASRRGFVFDPTAVNRKKLI